MTTPTPGTPDFPTASHEDISLDQQLALKVAADRLSRDFGGVYGPETIERFLVSSCDEFAGRATVVNYLPLLAERFASQRLQALARIEGHARDGKPVVLFVCTHHAGRSQMALGSPATLPATRRWVGPEAPNPAPASTPLPSPRRPNAVSTSPRVPEALDRRGRLRAAGARCRRRETSAATT